MSQPALIAMAASSLVMIIIVAVRYLVTSGLFALWGERLRPGLHAGLGAQIRREIGWSLLSAAIYGLPAGIVAWGWHERGWTLIYQDATAYPLWWMPVSFLLCLLIHDSWFYWTHRLMHRPAIFRALHAVHHASRPPTAWAAMSFHPGEALTGAFVIPALVFVIPLHIGVVLAVLVTMTLMGVTNHMGWELFPTRLVHGRAGRWLITATHHQLHHDSYRCNYGLYFRLWDRLCRTDHGLGHFDRGGGRGQ
ncbi:sterol desaturase family protein [Sphingobium sp. DEHP117]|uniref:sterol desaturase family protein n=1 Tax=Sphingobium sp. DEHP117 TaxID=2993436 RepID=UPI0027D62898|nr:sterol desaturase family protein [Sphingobium sp. DEHP117]MDQ4419446.1 sterol desaturase family protein [Sphingobium sp. DEHP117]